MTLLLLAAASLAPAADVAPLVKPLLAAHERGEFGSIDGRAYAEGQRGGAEPTPYAQVSVLLLPRSVVLDAELAAIKAGYRDSPDTLVEAVPKVNAARLAFERALIDTGGGQLILGESSDASGVFRFPRVPEGAWTLLAWREIPGAKRLPSVRTSEAQLYKNRPQIFGSTTVVLWRMPLQVKAGEDVTVRLHDRNEWMTGIMEVRRNTRPHAPSPPGSGRRTHAERTRAEMTERPWISTEARGAVGPGRYVKKRLISCGAARRPSRESVGIAREAIMPRLGPHSRTGTRRLPGRVRSRQNRRNGRR